jgi:predicted DsbA family dithiol-disulfide isomerase
MQVEIWSDVVCPWCFIGVSRFDRALAAFEHHDQVEVVHRSFELEPDRQRGTVEPVAAMLEDRFGSRGAEADRQVAELARSEGLGYRTDRLVGSSLDAHRLLHSAQDLGRQQRLLKALFRANFAEARSVFAPEDLADLAGRAGFDPASVRRVLEDPDAYLEEVRADEREASELGIGGVPYFLIDRRFALSGAQSVDSFSSALRTAWAERMPAADSAERRSQPPAA